ncbi:MAG TPA: peptidylprolyl isomerase [Bacteroidota bacterium]|nr:peptidylprolyl isomerase [Bacteroidota bacterium]
MVVLETSMGKIEVAMFRAEAPKTVENFLSYVRDKFYDSTIFHRVIKNFMIQGGGFTKDLKQKSTKPSIVNEADNGLKNEVGTIAMARTPDPNSATSQFFINVKDNSSLNFKNKTPQGWGYCVFGRVVKGMDVVNKIENVKTGSANGMQDVPVEPVVILTVRQKGKNEPAPK